MTMADFGQPVIDIPPEAGGFNTDRLKQEAYRPMIDSRSRDGGAEYLMELLQYSPPVHPFDVLVRANPPLRGGQGRHGLWLHIACPLFRARPASPAHGQTGFLPHPAGPGRPHRSRPWAGTPWAFRAT
jgi:multiple sugar transport system substrate-binding protein